MNFSFEYLCSHLMYDLVVDGNTYHGDVDYVSSHFGSGNQISFSISPYQEKELQPFVNDYLNALQSEPNLTVEEFYNRKTI